MQQYSNVAFLPFFSFLLGFSSPLVWFITPMAVLLLYVMPSLADTSANLSDADSGIPIYYYNNEFSILKTMENPFLWLPSILEFTMDYLHSLSYLFVYWQEYFQGDKYTFPTITYKERSGHEIANDLISMYGWLYAIQVLSTPFNIFFGIVSIPAVLLVKYKLM